MNEENKLPIIRKKKKINQTEFIALAERVRKSFLEEQKQFEKELRKDEIRKALWILY